MHDVLKIIYPRGYSGSDVVEGTGSDVVEGTGSDVVEKKNGVER